MPLTSRSQSAHPPTIAWAWVTAAVQTVWGITRMHTQQQHEDGDSETMLNKNQKRKKGLCRLKTLQPAGLQPAGLRHPATSTSHTYISVIGSATFRKQCRMQAQMTTSAHQLPTHSGADVNHAAATLLLFLPPAVPSLGTSSTSTQRPAALPTPCYHTPRCSQLRELKNSKSE